MSRKRRGTSLPARYLRRIWLDLERVPDRVAYPFCLPFLRDGFELDFERPIAIIGRWCARRYQATPSFPRSPSRGVESSAGVRYSARSAAS